MGALLGVYDPEKVTIDIISPVLGNHRVSGFGEGSFITAERTDPELYKAKVGAHGDTTLARNLNRTGKYSIILSQGSPSLAKFDALKEINTPFAVKVQDGSETPLISGSEKAVVMSEPTAERGAEAADVTIEIWCQDLTTVRSSV